MTRHGREAALIRAIWRIGHQPGTLWLSVASPDVAGQGGLGALRLADRNQQSTAVSDADGATKVTGGRGFKVMFNLCMANS
jgi:hypothetical protein